MSFSKEDQIKYLPNIVKHESAGGFVFFENSTNHELFVALLRTKDGHYVIPKGHLKKGESPEMAAAREISEELSLTHPLELISHIGTSNYRFSSGNSETIHEKNVHLYVFYTDQKLNIKPQVEEGFETAEWISFEIAVEKLSFDKENLLKARQNFYYNKPVKKYNNLLDILSITIVIPTHNGAKIIKNTLISIAERLKDIPEYIKKEIVICTDHCTDNTKQIVEEFIKSQNQASFIIKLINNDGLKGKANVLNKLFVQSSGEFFCTIDDDVILEKNCLLFLLEELISNPNLKSVFSAWKRMPFKSGNVSKNFWHWILGVKFDIQPYDKPQEFMRGACMMLKRENFVLLPPVLNEDQFIQYMYWPQVREIQNSIIYFNSVSDIFDYYKRSLRIMVGSKQMLDYFTQDRIKECGEALSRRVNYRKIIKLPWKQLIPFLLYLFIKKVLNIYKNIKLNFIKNYEWFRFKQN